MSLISDLNTYILILKRLQALAVVISAMSEAVHDSAFAIAPAVWTMNELSLRLPRIGTGAR